MLSFSVDPGYNFIEDIVDIGVAKSNSAVPLIVWLAAAATVIAVSVGVGVVCLFLNRSESHRSRVVRDIEARVADTAWVA
jgi:hypothetical protein